MKPKQLKKLLEKNNFFDKIYYLRSYRDARLADATPIDHYINVGIKENRKPNSCFDPEWYLKTYFDVKKAGINPVVHFLLYGNNEGRLQNAEEFRHYNDIINNGDFDRKFYKNNYDDLKVLDDNFDLVTHYVRHGQYEGRIFKRPTPVICKANASDSRKKDKQQINRLKAKLYNFENYHTIESKYLFKRLHQLSDTYKSRDNFSCNEDFDALLIAVTNVLDIYHKLRKANKRFLNAFDELEYLATHKDVNDAVKNEILSSGLEHLLIHGWEEVNTGKRRLYYDTHKFNEKDYLRAYPDVSNAINNEDFVSALEHFISYGSEKFIESKNRRVDKNSCIEINQTDPEKATIMICAHVVGESLFGSERSLIDMVAAASQNYNVILLAPTMNDIYLSAVNPYVNKILTMRYGWWKVDTQIEQGRVDEIAKIIKDNNVCLVHVNTIMLREPLLAAKQVNVNSVTHIRELIIGDKDLVELIGLDVNEIIENVVSRSDYIIGNSQATLQAYGLEDSKKSFLVYNTVNCKEFKPKKLERIINVGIISSNLPKKGIFDFMQIAEACKDQENLFFKLIGPKNQHTELIQDKNISNLQVCGYREHPTEAMDEIDILLNLSHFKESFGRTVAEAMASSKPVIAYKWGAVPELIKEAETGYLVDYKDTNAVAKHLIELAQKPSEIEILGENGRKRALEHFDYSIYQEQLINIYRSIIDAEKASKIKIAYFMWHFPVPSETFVLNELRSLAQQNYDVKVYCKQSPFKEFRPDFPIEWQRINDVDDFSEKLNQDRREIIHSHFVYPTVTEMVWPASIKSGVPFTFIAHAQDIFRYTNIEKNRIDEVSKSPNCLKVFVPSKFHFNYLADQGVPPEKMLLTPNTVDPDLYSDGLAIKHEERKQKSVCAIHRFTEKKGLGSLIESAKYLDSSITINIYGYGELEDDYKNLIQDNFLSNVKICGGVKSRKQMLEVFSKHDLFACPSIRANDGDMDGIPTVLMESMASGLPVITTSVAGIPDLVIDELTGLVTESNPQQIAKDIERFYAMPESKVEAIRDNARQLIESNFNTFYATDNLLRVWENKAIDIIIVSWNYLPELKEICHRILKYTSSPYRLIIVDNKSESDVISYLKDFDQNHEQVTVVFNTTNDMVGPGTNIALETGNSNYAIYVCGKEGFVFNYGWELPLIKYMNQHPKVGQAGTLGYSPSYLYGKQYPQGIPVFNKFRNQEFAMQNPERIFKHVQGGFFIIRRSMYEEIGGFSYDVPHNSTDVEYSYYVESCGWELGQIPEMMALFNKTRPGLFSRIDEKTTAIHPPTMDDIQDIERVIDKHVDLCHVCESRDSKFEVYALGEHICSNCGSNNSDRTLFRYLAESVFTYRRVPALGVNLGNSIKEFWSNQFQGRMLSTSDLSQELRTKQKLDHSDGSMHLIYLANLQEFSYEQLNKLLKESERLLSSQGQLVLHLNDHFSEKYFSELFNEFPETLRLIKKERFVSEVCHFDWNPILIFEKEKDETA